MRDAFGGLVNIIIVVVFLVVITGYLAFNVNYTKAFRMKNKIITTIEQYDGVCNAQCHSKIQEYAATIGYSISSLNLCDSAPTYSVKINGTTTNIKCDCTNGYCIDPKVTTVTEGGDIKTQFYYNVETATSIDVPMVKQIMSNIKLFRVRGSTKTFKG